jgi:hypothetical protein
MQTPAEQRAAVLRAHARLGPNGRVSRCPGSRKFGVTHGGKVIYSTRRAAVAAEISLANLGALRQEAYECRAQPGHWHLGKAKGST